LLKSMTGYGRGESSREGFDFNVEMRSVNHRYADLALRIPRELYPLEDRIRRLVLAGIKRGRVEVTVTLGQVGAEARAVMVNYELVESYCRALRKLAAELELPADLSINALLQLPDVLNLQGTELPEELVWTSLEQALAEALSRLMQRREEEGANLYRDLSERCSQVDTLVQAVAERAVHAREECRLRVEKKFSEYLTGQFEENRILMECALLVEKMGIDEELVRLESHLEAFAKTMAMKGPSGRKLDFIAQEMFRETNTIGAKASDSRLAGLVVEIKSELEKIREQIQNIE
jgi:uncharacterized protein (TIGR00255 family)